MIILTDKQIDQLERVVAEKEKGHMDSLTIMKGLAVVAQVLLDSCVKKEPPVVISDYESKIMDKYRDIK